MVNVFSAITGGDPFAWIPAARQQGPLVKFGGGPWLALGYDACITALRDHTAFSSTVMGGMGRAGVERSGFGYTMLGSDPPDHTRLRTLVSYAFTPRRIAALEPRIRQIADELLDEVIGDGAFDLMPAFAEPLPVTIIAEMLGIPVADRKEFKRWSDSIVSFGGGTRNGDGQSAMEELTSYLRRQLDRRRSNPTDDLIGALMVAEEAGERLSPEEALATCVLLLIAGNETTTNLIGNAIAALDEAGLMREVAASPELLSGAVEETLRHQPPVISIVRNTVRDVEMSGQTVPAGSFVFVVLAAANRDPEVFAEPDRFDIRRNPNRHIAFGHGIHFCLGAPLARLEARAGMEVLLRRCPNLQRAESGPVLRLPSMILYGPKSLPVTT
jgi:cytochrome P450